MLDLIWKDLLEKRQELIDAIAAADASPEFTEEDYLQWQEIDAALEFRPKQPS